MLFRPLLFFSEFIPNFGRKRSNRRLCFRRSWPKTGAKFRRGRRCYIGGNIRRGRTIVREIGILIRDFVVFFWPHFFIGRLRCKPVVDLVLCDGSVMVNIERVKSEPVSRSTQAQFLLLLVELQNCDLAIVVEVPGYDLILQ